MLKNIKKSLPLILIYLVSTPIQASGWYAGYAALPMEISGMEDIHVSDWETYGLGGLEGRALVPIGRQETSGAQGGIVLGYESSDNGDITTIVELYHTQSDGLSVNTIAVGTRLNFIDNDRFTIGLSPKIGYISGKADLGTVEMLPGKTPPIITSEGTIRGGDKIDAEFDGYAALFSLVAQANLTKNLGIHLQAGYMYGATGSFTVKAGEVEIESDSTALVKTDGSSTQAGIDPEISMSGAMYSVGVNWKF